jgi:membrane-associated protease RseP (regulator of RpoE activity)
MAKRNYLLISLIAALGLSIGYVEVTAGQKDKDKDKEKEKAEQKEKFKLDGEPSLFSFPLNLGEGSYLGVYLEEVTSERLRELGLKEERGAVVMKVVEASPASKAGLKENDVIVSFNGRKVESVRELQRLLNETPAGRSVTLDIIRGGNQQSLSATLSRRSPDTFFVSPDISHESSRRLNDRLLERNRELGERLGRIHPDFGTFNFSFPRAFGAFRGSRLGVSVETLSDQLAEYFGIKGRQGLLVTEVMENTPASKAGLKAGDVIVAVDNNAIESLNTLINALDNKDEGPVALTIVRNRSEQSVTVTLEKRETRPATRRRARVLTTVAGVA